MILTQNQMTIHTAAYEFGCIHKQFNLQTAQGIDLMTVDTLENLHFGKLITYRLELRPGLQITKFVASSKWP